MRTTDLNADIAIIGAGAAGLATAIFAARRKPSLRIVAFDGAVRLGAKILAAGGGRCNVTNRTVTADDYNGGSRNTIRNVLAAFSVPKTVTFFAEIGVTLHEEENGKLFPDSNKARDVVDALVREAVDRGVSLLADHRVSGITIKDAGFSISTSRGVFSAKRVVLATGGLSMPQTGSDGGGFALAQRLGHSLVPTTPALVPLILDGDFHASLSGISQEVEVTIHASGRKKVSVRGPLLWTHFGASGPAILDISRHWHRARLEKRDVTVTASMLPGEEFTTLEHKLMELAADHPKTFLRNTLSGWLPARVADTVLAYLEIRGEIPLAHLSREQRRRLAHALLEWPLPVRDSRGYAHAEITAGGVPLDEIHAATLESRKHPGLYLVGEILDVDGRIGGFNFQWAWSTAAVAAQTLAEAP